MIFKKDIRYKTQYFRLKNLSIFYFSLITLYSILVTSCIKDKPNEPSNSNININSTNKVYVVNEGGYGKNNASVSLYDATSGAIAEDYFHQQNTNTVLGDVCQSITKYNSKYYIVVNNSSKIEIVSSTDFKKNAVITGFNSPRYLLPITYNKAYVTDLHAHSIQIVDLNSNSIIGSIPTYSNTEQMTLIYNKAFVTSYSSNYCYAINTITDVITDSILVNKGAASICLDKNSKVWVLSSSKLVRINPVSMQVELALSFNTNETPTQLCINKTKDTLYYLNKGICQLPIVNGSLSLMPLVSQGSKVYYGLGVNPTDYTIYVSDAVDYVQKSTIEIYTMSGVMKKSFKAGIISNGFVFSE